jgi:UDP-N-acetyl-D-mannosaminuronate dehydrogenase
VAAEKTPLKPATPDQVVVLTDHPGVDYERVVRVGPRVFDTRNATRLVTMDREKITKL